MRDYMDKLIREKIIEPYSSMVAHSFPSLINKWPIISGYNLTTFTCDDWLFIVLHHKGPGLMTHAEHCGVRNHSEFGLNEITEENISQIKSELLSIYAKSEKDAIIALKTINKSDNEIRLDLTSITADLNELFEKHKLILGLSKMKIFLSHKGGDKSLIRDYAILLKELGFVTWFDEDDAPAGSSRNRIFSDGMAESCAAIFFITENFKDERDIGEEIDFALYQKREKGDDFAIIILCFQGGNVPDILKQRFIYKEPKNDILALYEIIKALPIKVGRVEYKKHSNH